MKRFLVIGCIVLVASGCWVDHRYEIDLSRVEDFDWNGRLRITQRHHG